MASEPILYCDGAYVPESQARLSAFDLGVQFGDGVYEVVSAWKGLVFRLDLHVARLVDTLHAARIDTGIDAAGWSHIVCETARRNGLADAAIKIIVTRGMLAPGNADPRAAKPSVRAFATPYAHLGTAQQRETGIRLQIGHQRGMAPDTLDPRYKHTARLQYQLAKIEALDSGYDDVVWLSAQGFVEEAPRSNIFLVKDGVLRSPALGVLHGNRRAHCVSLRRPNRAGRGGRNAGRCPHGRRLANAAPCAFGCATRCVVRHGGVLRMRRRHRRQTRTARLPRQSRRRHGCALGRLGRSVCASTAACGTAGAPRRGCARGRCGRGWAQCRPCRRTSGLEGRHPR